MNINQSKQTNKDETIIDFKISLTFLKENYRAFLSTEIFAIISFIIVFSALFAILLLAYVIIPNLTINDLFIALEEQYNSSQVFIAIISIISYIVLIGFMNCQYGLAYDIFSSGDMFAEFKSSFHYFKNHWWKYVILTLVMGTSMIIPNRVLAPPFRVREREEIQVYSLVIIRITQFILSWIFLILFSNTLPSVTAQGKLFRSFKESFLIVKKDTKRLMKTWGLFFLIFQLPILVLSLSVIVFNEQLEGTITLYIVASFLFLFYLITFFVGYPLRTLISTRIYNNAFFQTKEEGEEKNK